MNLPDPRPGVTTAQQWLVQLIEGTKDVQLDAPTPCADFDVRTLLEHLLAVEERLAIAGNTGIVDESAPRSMPLPASSPAGAFRAAIERGQAVWADDSLLTRPVTAPFGTMPGGAFLGAMLSEILVHAWDLATATGQPSEAPAPELAQASLAVMTKVLPASPRGGQVPFSEVVESAPDAGPTERLANWTGRTSR